MPGSIETRAISVIQDLEWLECKEKWRDIKCIVRISSKRELGPKVEQEERYFISTLQTPAEDLLKRIRRHWAIENNLHWCLDVGFREDQSRVRTGNTPKNFSILRKWALNLLTQDQTHKVGLESKRNQAGWDATYLSSLLLKLI